jgi:hypothetical protein
MYPYIEGSPTEIQNPTHWKVTGRSTTDLPPVLSPSSILPPLRLIAISLSRGKIWISFLKLLLIILLCLKFLSLKLR